MESEKTVAVIDRWIADYYSYLVWKEFHNNGCISSFWLRDCLRQKSPVYAVLGTPSTEDTVLRSRLLVELMYKLSVGLKLFEEQQSSEKTLLEEAMDVFQQLLNDLNIRQTLNTDTISSMNLLLKQEAVLACARKNDFNTAAVVFERQWRHWKNEQELAVKEKLSDVLEQRSSAHRYLQKVPYSALIDGSREFLCAIFSSLKTPFLLTAGQIVCQKFMHPGDSANAKPLFTDNEQPKSPPLTQQAGGDEEFKVAEINCPVVNIIPSDANSSIPRTVAETDSSKVKTEETGNIRTSEGDKLYQLDSIPSSVQLLSSEISVKEEKVFSNNLDIKDFFDVSPSKDTKMRKRAWSPEEEKNIYLAVQSCGVGNWKAVADSLSSSRSNIDVKDKWRTMKKQGKLEDYEKLYGPVRTKWKYSRCD